MLWRLLHAAIHCALNLHAAPQCTPVRSTLRTLDNCFEVMALPSHATCHLTCIHVRSHVPVLVDTAAACLNACGAAGMRLACSTAPQIKLPLACPSVCLGGLVAGTPAPGPRPNPLPAVRAAPVLDHGAAAAHHKHVPLPAAVEVRVGAGQRGVDHPRFLGRGSSPRLALLRSGIPHCRRGMLCSSCRLWRSQSSGLCWVCRADASAAAPVGTNSLTSELQPTRAPEEEIRSDES